MDHAINDLKTRMNATIDMWEGMISREDIEPEIKAYVNAINILENYYYGQKRTRLDIVLSYFPTTK